MEEYRIDPSISYDVVQLPSQGLYYPNKKKSVRVSYLTASDENILSSPSLIASNGTTDELLRRKILDKDISVDDLVDEDRMAILIFLRNTAFGSDYTITAYDSKTQKEFEYVCDISSLKIKDFTLEADSNGEYSYFMPVCKKNVTFTFLTRKQLDDINAIKNSWNGQGVAPIITKQLEFMIKSVEGSRDLLMIKNFTENLPIKDSQDFRKFVENNKPGLDLVQNVTTPSGDTIQIEIGFGVEFFRPFYGI